MNDWQTCLFLCSAAAAMPVLAGMKALHSVRLQVSDLRAPWATLHSLTALEFDPPACVRD